METFRILPETTTIFVCINFFTKVDQLTIVPLTYIDSNSNLKKSDE